MSTQENEKVVAFLDTSPNSSMLRWFLSLTIAFRTGSLISFARKLQVLLEKKVLKAFAVSVSFSVFFFFFHFQQVIFSFDAVFSERKVFTVFQKDLFSVTFSSILQ